MKAAADTTRVLITVPRDVRAWLEESARYNGGTLGAEAVRSIRERMERQQEAASRRDVSAADHHGRRDRQA